jgi:hypothetical protein
VLPLCRAAAAGLCCPGCRARLLLPGCCRSPGAAGAPGAARLQVPPVLQVPRGSRCAHMYRYGQGSMCVHTYRYVHTSMCGRSWRYVHTSMCGHMDEAPCVREARAGRARAAGCVRGRCGGRAVLINRGTGLADWTGGLDRRRRLARWTRKRLILWTGQGDWFDVLYW